MAELAGSDFRVRELVTRLEQPQNLVSYHLRLLRDGGLVTATRSSADRRDSYYHLDLDRCARALAGSGTALHPALQPSHPPSGPRSQQGRGRPPVGPVRLHRQQRPLAGGRSPPHAPPAGAVRRASAGSRPKEACTPAPSACCASASTSTSSGQHPGTWTTSPPSRSISSSPCATRRARSARTSRPRRRMHWSIPDPARRSQGYAAFERAADEIDMRVGHLLPVLATTRSTRRVSHEPTRGVRQRPLPRRRRRGRDRLLHRAPGLHAPHERRARLRRRPPRSTSAPAVRPRELRCPRDTRRRRDTGRQPHPSRGRRPGRRDHPPARRRQ